MERVGTWTLALGGLLLAACAGYSVTKDGTGTGYDVYRPDPYLLRVPIQDKDGTITGFSFELKWLPNYSERYRVRSWTGFGASDIEFTFEEGWKLTGINDQTDNTKVLEQLTGLTKHVVKPDILEAVPRAGQEEDVAWSLMSASADPVLYRIEFDDCGRPCGLKRFPVGWCADPAGAAGGGLEAVAFSPPSR